MNRFTRTTVALAFAVVAANGLGACSDSTMPDMDHGTMQSSMPNGAGFNAADVQFAQMMIPHDAQAVQMAELAGATAADLEVKQLAASIKSAQQPEIDTMTGWLKTWNQPMAQPGGHDMPGMNGMNGMPGMMSDADLASLNAASGLDFDRRFTRMMIAHHNGASQMARDVRKNGTNPDVKGLAVMIEQAQTTEVTQLQNILDRL
jgi:uncharacterized protein (DUF305 family)